MPTAPSPWHQLGLRWNPFGEPPPEDFAALILPWESPFAADWLRAPRRVQQYLGDAGRGKTSRLRWLSARFPQAPYLYIEEGARPPVMPSRATTMPAPLALLLDEAQRLAPRRRRRLFASIARGGRSLALASHADLSGELREAGLSCRTEIIAGLDAQQLKAVVERRIAWARLPGQAPALLTHADAEKLLARFGDDLRAILSHLYEAYQLALTNPQNARCLPVN